MELLIDGHTVIVDDEDAQLFEGRKWRAVEQTRGKFYIRWQSRISGKFFCLYLHRLIASAPDGSVVDHIDGDTLNCRRSNLRIGDHVLNARNVGKIRNRSTTSRFKGVNWHKHTRKWVAKIRHLGRQTHLGYFESEVEAAYCYDLASIKFHGYQGKTNFLPMVLP